MTFRRGLVAGWRRRKEWGWRCIAARTGVVYLGFAEDELKDGPRRVCAEGGKVDHEHLLADERRERVGHHRLAGAARSVEEEDEAAAV